MSRTLRVHPGTGRVASWRGLELSEPTDLPPNVMFDAERCLAAIVPDGYEKGNVYWHRFEDEQLENLEVLDLVFQISGTPEAAEAACMVIGAYLKTVFEQVQTGAWHSSVRVLYSDNPAYDRGEPVPSVFIYRIYPNVEGMCEEHPEMLLGAPMGMYHCPVCGEMQLAGMPHVTNSVEPSKE